ncbi:adhesin [Neisseria sp.]|uniref:ACP-like domain-containing protein n=1 Tax=Neisseria sp. TaxID=192066 RepID=UPI00359F3AD7
MKTLSAITLGALLLTAATAQAAIDNPTVSRKAVSYSCQSGKKVKVTYGFNRQGLPTYAKAFANGKNRYMPINLSRSDNVETIFGDENSFSLSTDYMDRKNYRQRPVMITAPDGEIVFKNCSPRRSRR